jgi:hypothetical protein
LSFRHWAQRVSKQNGVPPSPQSELFSHWTQRWFSAHVLAGAVQSVPARHSTQSPVTRSHFLFVPVVHCASAVHPGSQRPPGPQRCPVGQSVLVMHWTQANRVGLHFGRAAGQSVFAMQVTHVCVVGSQSGAAGRQSVFVLHSTQAPVVASQSAMSRGQRRPLSTAHEPWHW